MEQKHHGHAFVCVRISEILCNGYCIASVEVVFVLWNKWGGLVRAVGDYEQPFWLDSAFNSASLPATALQSC